MSVTNTILPPFAITTLPQYMRYELRRRSGYINKDKKIAGNYGFDYKKLNYQDFKGPKSVWVRVCSNAIVNGKNGLVLYGGTKFEDAYGLSVNGGEKKQIVGYEPETGAPHYLYINTVKQPYRPPPGITGIEVSIRMSIYRVAKISWTCYSLDQMNYLANYMFTPYTTIVAEWGWDTFYKESLIDISTLGKAATFDEKEPNTIKEYGEGILGAYTNPKSIEDRIEWSQGNYDATIGHITNFNYSFDQASNAFHCVTEIASNSKYYFSLATANLETSTSENDKKDSGVSSVSLRSYFTSKEFEGKIRASLSDPNTNVSAMNGPVKAENRVFSLSKFIGDQQGEQKHKEKIYITFGLFIDVLNSFIKTKVANGVKGISLDIKDVVIGAHPNMISPSLDFLIPNASAPFIPSICLSTKTNAQKLAATDVGKIDELPYGSVGDFWEVTPTTEASNADKKELDTPDKKLLSIVKEKFNKTTYRYDLNKIMNPNRATGSFPQADKSKSKYFGFLKDIYLNIDLVKSAVESQTKLNDILTMVCNRLNAEIPFWNLQPILHPSDSNIITIVDSNYFSIEEFEKSKSANEAKLNPDEPALYYFDTFSQDSVVTGFNFNVKLSNAVASMVINQVNTALSADGTRQTQNQSSMETAIDRRAINDRIIQEIKLPSIDTTSVAPSPTEVRTEITNLNDKSLYFRKGNTMLRLTIPPERKDLLQYFMIDSSPYFTNISTMPIPGTSAELSMLGIAGFKTFQVFGVENLPEPYTNKVLFKILELKHNIDLTNGWSTSITAMVLPNQSVTSILK